ncbi:MULTISPECIES: lipid-A-disaccharide synthase [Alteromonas]|jgi:lipid-A-disaccharide synthase|uniref:lipid-A-disaccharide synthase n=1 Tax=Alteromonas TaxID=226 RepID=UPI000355676B|nr:MULTISPECIES: lipid-A-disaccharide synthase [Alteromonas]AGP92738.1 tetraacyldisaccharide 4'-kinase [Alteromonas mediterranea U8]MBR9783538.1 lipid-A-disaccharide synthase [Gammaproteobacteria bacterium]MEA3382730.1 lipid-A-disaccharide synthase [Pseudomonadota bacterium]AGP84739.1 tetraacyldisaccharide 4'-kinase [Alteromonas mediterranea U4]AGP88854.1 tetraacyldisaccharide 4'-kinase [Alteromonas mediterranea U7]|tara:strand:+ start:1917 stop:3065 length:1149 start_codon:yes stop_codon:yes gene_type:complete
MSKPIRIGMVAGEPSGDILAAGMVAELKRQYPDAIIEGIGGPNMIDAGFHSLFDMETLSVMGLVEVLAHLPAILKVKKQLLAHFEQNPPDIFVGVDAPDFNLRVEKALKARGIKTMHYVSPTVWAWREKRIHKIAKAANRVLGLFPFEQQVYDKYNVPYTFVGHTMADAIALEPDQSAARQVLGVDSKAPVLAVLPGSRRGEVDTLLPVFLETIEAIHAKRSDIQFLIPAANEHRLAQIKALLLEADNAEARLPIQVTQGTSRDAMIASDVILLASGTATLEAMLCKRPMVAAYSLAPLTYKIMQRLYKAPFFTLPNLLANEAIIPELLQEEVNAENMSNQLLNFFESDNSALIARFTDLHHTLKCNADKTAAKAVVEELFA